MAGRMGIRQPRLRDAPHSSSPSPPIEEKASPFPLPLPMPEQAALAPARQDVLGDRGSSSSLPRSS